MKGKPDHGARLHAGSAIRRQGGILLAGFVLVMALGAATLFRHGAPAFGPADMPVSDAGFMPENVPAKFVSAPESGSGILFVQGADTPAGKDGKIEAWREEGIRMASDLTGIPEEFFRWLQDKGVPVGEFMRFLMPFLEWLEMVEPQNGTQPPPQPRNQPRETAV
jgi:hypothetical protein